MDLLWTLVEGLDAILDKFGEGHVQGEFTLDLSIPAVQGWGELGINEEHIDISPVFGSFKHIDRFSAICNSFVSLVAISLLMVAIRTREEFTSALILINSFAWLIRLQLVFESANAFVRLYFLIIKNYMRYFP